MSGRVLLILLALALFAPQVTGEAPAPYAPASVAAEPLGTALALVEWAPGLEPADAYRIYGVDEGGLTLLLDTATSGLPLVVSVVVPAGYRDYAVSGLKDNTESAPVYALKPCMYIQTDPPGIVREDCDSKAHAGSPLNPDFSIRSF